MPIWLPCRRHGVGMQFPDFTAYRGLLTRSGAGFRQSWRARRKLDLKQRLPEEAAFLPAHLEIVETPAHPAPQWTGRIIAILGLSLLALAVFGHLDIVAIAPGKLVPNARVKVIQPAITGVVRSIL